MPLEKIKISLNDENIEESDLINLINELDHFEIARRLNEFIKEMSSLQKLVSCANITIEKVSADPDDEDNKNYDVLDQFSMENKDKETMKKAIESFLKNGGDPGSIPY